MFKEYRLAIIKAKAAIIREIGINGEGTKAPLRRVHGADDIEP